MHIERQFDEIMFGVNGSQGSEVAIEFQVGKMLKKILNSCEKLLKVVVAVGSVCRVGTLTT